MKTAFRITSFIMLFLKTMTKPGMSVWGGKFEDNEDIIYTWISKKQVNMKNIQESVLENVLKIVLEKVHVLEKMSCKRPWKIIRGQIFKDFEDNGNPRPNQFLKKKSYLVYTEFKRLSHIIKLSNTIKKSR